MHETIQISRLKRLTGRGDPDVGVGGKPINFRGAARGAFFTKDGSERHSVMFTSANYEKYNKVQFLLY